MISSITNTSYNRPVYFGCNQQKPLVNIVNNIFSNLANTRNSKSKLGFYLGKTTKINYVVEEKVFGKEAKIYFMDENDYCEIQICRDSKHPLRILPLTEGLSVDSASELISQNLCHLNYKA